MAAMMKIVLTVLAAGCVMSQSTSDDNESAPDQLQLKIDKLEQEHQQMTQLLHLILDQQQRQFSKLNELRTILAHRLGRFMQHAHLNFCWTRKRVSNGYQCCCRRSSRWASCCYNCYQILEVGLLKLSRFLNRS